MYSLVSIKLNGLYFKHDHSHANCSSYSISTTHPGTRLVEVPPRLPCCWHSLARRNSTVFVFPMLELHTIRSIIILGKFAADPALMIIVAFPQQTNMCYATRNCQSYTNASLLCSHFFPLEISPAQMTIIWRHSREHSVRKGWNIQSIILPDPGVTWKLIGRIFRCYPAKGLNVP